MNRISSRLALFACPAALALLLVSITGVVAAAEPRTLTGGYVWDRGGSDGDLEALFTPTGENRWNVSFHFTFRGREHTYTGTAKGSLADGKLEGTVLNEGKRRTFAFAGEFDGDTFRGTHSEIEGNSEFRTGTLTLRGS